LMLTEIVAFSWLACAVTASVPPQLVTTCWASHRLSPVVAVPDVLNAPQVIVHVQT